MKKTAAIIVILILVSCGSVATKNSGKQPLYEVLTQQQQGGASIHFFEILTEPNEIKMLQNDTHLRNKISVEDVQRSNFVILNLGEKMTGGYAVGVESVVETDKNIIITVKETSPEPDAMVSQNITYPFCVVKINSKKEIIIK
ncbi:protease complex subunit PrcB family protein [Flavobacterium acetivorans]|uniref:protease complex subunit PrcB family protein n=1 Tax=Flavobacterium acetivorans TaxID=2893883 RepID=UPI001E4E1F98|nr:protease complex subunit PrcB family protein [Flavobacterium sp. F-29]UFH35217.1 protease complex subunit PrcB family protein [Flavobacterium sp. F-29]